jgi:copper chaperone CopZ
MAEIICRNLRALITSLDFLNMYRISEKDFTRNRKMPFQILVVFILRLLRQSLQKEIVDFFETIGVEYTMTKSAFCQSRVKLKPEAFIELNDCLCNTFYTDNEIRTWNGYRLIGIDGSTIHLPDSPELIKFFGCQTNQVEKKSPMARISTCFDLLNEIIIDPVIKPYKTSEYVMAVEHLSKLKREDLVIFDRGFGAIWLFYLLSVKEINFVIRISRSLFPEFWEKEGVDSEIITIETCSKDIKKQLRKLGVNFKPFKVRLVKVILESGETEVLVTSLLEEQKYPAMLFEELYFKRWGVEGEYNHLKNHMEVENFSGKSVIAVKQDFYASALLENLRSVFSKDAAEKLKKKNKKRKPKYEYKINRNLSIGFIKEKLIDLLLSDDPGYIEKVKELFILEPVPIRQGRKNKRVFHISRKKFHMNNRRTL